MPIDPRHHTRRGQAMIELTVALVVILALTVGLLHLTRLGRAQSAAMIEARREAGAAALARLPTLAPTDFIGDWEPGPDDRHFTRDDVAQPDLSHGFSLYILDRAAADTPQWDVLHSASYSALPDLHGHPQPSAAFGLVHGNAARTVPLIAAFQHLIYNADEIEIEADVWLTHTDNIY